MHKNVCSKDLPSYWPRDVLERLRQPYGGGGSILLGEWFDWVAFHQTFPSNGPPVSSFWVSGEGYSPGGSESMVGSKLLRRKNDRFLDRKKGRFFFLTLQKRYYPQAQALWIYRAIFLPPLPSCISHPEDWVPGGGWVPSFAREIQGLPKDLVCC